MCRLFLVCAGVLIALPLPAVAEVQVNVRASGAQANSAVAADALRRRRSRLEQLLLDGRAVQRHPRPAARRSRRPDRRGIPREHHRARATRPSRP